MCLGVHQDSTLSFLLFIIVIQAITGEITIQLSCMIAILILIAEVVTEFKKKFQAWKRSQELTCFQLNQAMAKLLEGKRTVFLSLGR